MYHNPASKLKNDDTKLQITPIPVFTDNYVWALHNSTDCIIVDPGLAGPVLDFLHQQHLQLNAILITHWHADHTGGISDLLRHQSVPVYGPANSAINGISHPVHDSNTITLLGQPFSVLAVPGHTLDHLAFYDCNNAILFCGDTLFGAGCGRIFEGTADMMLASLLKLACLPPQTRICCAHEYTLANLHFALAAEPDNQAILQRLLDCEALRRQGLLTLPSTLQQELATNPFLRTSADSVITQALNQGAASTAAVDIFSCLREWKNHF